MIVRLIAALAVFTTTALAAPGQEPITPGEQIDLAVEYLHVHAGQARISVGKAEGSIWPIVLQGRTEGISGMLDIREHLVSYWDSEARLPRGSDSNSIEIGDRHSDRSRFDREAGKLYVQTHRPGKLLERTFDVPPAVQDMAGALMYLRLQPLAPGARYEFPVFVNAQSFPLVAEVVGRERVETPAGAWDAVKVRVRSEMKGSFHSRETWLWLSDDPRHVPVKISADFAVGSVVATLRGYKAGGEVARR
ncbi:DUF3108 domain-containing protein [Anaeromyxobacter paludicola]|uniref:DUF3108 domain-containing protein n=1 Tax=Anaeromyxobacter paludicola TaxID=2918171 RepID=A0ABN6N586_9BACT|nr:DUF3108 domain-containing protein [Anaeromyxobacter paludicola]BDG07117.1 hypothetical protein AMPC_02300 [Anaeromyxobacter paludicola]